MSQKRKNFYVRPNSIIPSVTNRGRCRHRDHANSLCRKCKKFQIIIRKTMTFLNEGISLIYSWYFSIQDGEFGREANQGLCTFSRHADQCQCGLSPSKPFAGGGEGYEVLSVFHCSISYTLFWDL